LIDETTRQEAARRAMAELNVGKVEEDLNKLIERRARHNERVNAEATMYRLSVARKAEALRQENRAAWIEHFRCMALVHHDIAAENAAKADELEANNKGAA
jgi:hypothetical protein